MYQVIYEVMFIRFDEDIISVISNRSRYFSDESKAKREANEWSDKSPRNEFIIQAIDVE